MTKLTAVELNKIIVNLRKVINTALVHVAQKLKSQIDRYNNSSNAKKKRRIERYVAEIKATNKLKAKKDNISKFALVNVKSFQEFEVTNNTPPETVVKYKVVTSALVLKEIDKIRKIYPNWFQEIPFILQRFNDKKKTGKLIKTDKKLKEKMDEDSNNENNEEKTNVAVSDCKETKLKELNLNFFEEEKNTEDSNDVEFDNENNMEISNVELSDTFDDEKLKLKNKKIKKKFGKKMNTKNTNVIKKRTILNNKGLQKKGIKRKSTFEKEKKDLSVAKKKQTIDKLHPSWEAAKLNKQKIQAVIKEAINGGKSFGKHIKFD